MDSSDDRFFKAVDICSGVISVGMVVVGKKTLLGKLKPIREQIGWCFGFCDAATQVLGLEQAEAAAFISIVFTNVYGSSGPKHVGQVLENQFAFEPEMSEGGQAYVEWGRSGKTPLPPFPN
jgi:hypothetical protein